MVRFQDFQNNDVDNVLIVVGELGVLISLPVRRIKLSNFSLLFQDFLKGLAGGDDLVNQLFKSRARLKGRLLEVIGVKRQESQNELDVVVAHGHET